MMQFVLVQYRGYGLIYLFQCVKLFKLFLYILICLYAFQYKGELICQKCKKPDRVCWYLGIKYTQEAKNIISYYHGEYMRRCYSIWQSNLLNVSNTAATLGFF